MTEYRVWHCALYNTIAIGQEREKWKARCLGQTHGPYIGGHCREMLVTEEFVIQTKLAVAGSLIDAYNEIEALNAKEEVEKESM